MEALLIGIPFFLYIYIRVTLGNDISPQERDESLFEDGILLFKNDEFAKAFRYFEQVSIKYPKSATAFIYKAKCHFYFENWEEALKDFEKALRIDNSIAEAYHQKGLCFENLEDYKNALFEYKKASRMYLEKNVEVIRLIAALEFRFGDFENAKKSLKIATKLENEESQV